MKYVYVLRAGEGHYKVGVAKNVTRRVKELQTSNPTKMEVITTRLVDDAYRVENVTHMMLAAAKSGPSREWFELTAEQVLDVIIAINQNTEIDMTKQITMREILAAQTERQQVIEDNLNLIISEYRNTLPPPFSPEPPRPQEARVSAEELQRATDEEDFQQALTIVRTAGYASTSMLQRRMRIGYGRAARIVDRLESEGVIDEPDGNRPRKLK